MLRISTAGFCCGAILSATCAGYEAWGAEPSAGLPRYQFEVGQELLYEELPREELIESEETAQGPIRETISQWRVWPVRANGDGSWRLLVWRTCKMISKPRPTAPINWQRIVRRAILDRQLQWPGAPEVTFENDFLAYVDLAADGSYSKNGSLGAHSLFQFVPEEIFCTLPHDEQEMEQGWTQRSQVAEAETHLRPEGGPGDTLRLTGRHVEPTDSNYDLTTTKSFEFDRRRGLVTRIVTEMKWSLGSENRHVRTTRKLASEEMRDLEWVAKFAAGADEYFAADAQWTAAFEEAAAARTAKEALHALVEARKRLEQLRDGAAAPELRELYAARLKRHDSDAKWALEEAQTREAIYAKPALEWKTEDLDGRPVALADYRGRVVVLDFWYRGCSHCIRAMPKVKELARRFEGRPVQVMGVNNDRNVEDARFVIQNMGLNYPTIRDQEISQQYGVTGWPTLVVLDQRGKVALFHSGNTDNLVEAVSATVDGLLASAGKENTSGSAE